MSSLRSSFNAITFRRQNQTTPDYSPAPSVESTPRLVPTLQLSDKSPIPPPRPPRRAPSSQNNVKSNSNTLNNEIIPSSVRKPTRSSSPNDFNALRYSDTSISSNNYNFNNNQNQVNSSVSLRNSSTLSQVDVSSSRDFNPSVNGMTGTRYRSPSVASADSGNNSISKGTSTTFNNINQTDLNISVDLTQDPSLLLSIAKANTITLKTMANDMKILQTINGSDDLIRKFDEFLVELEQQYDNILTAMTREDEGLIIRMNLSNIIKSLTEIKLSFEELSKVNPFFMSKSKWSKKIISLAQTFRSKCNQLMTSITLDIISHKEEIISNIDGMNLSSAYAAYYGIGRPKNYKEAITKLVYLAEKEENVDAMILLAESYIMRTGQGLNLGSKSTKNTALGIQWLERASEYGSPVAKARLGAILINEAKTLGSDVILLSQFQESNNEFLYQRGRDLLLEAAVKGNVEAETTLGVISYEAGDYVQAYEWFNRAVEHGSPRAMNYLGLLYFHGDGVIRQSELAYQYFVTAASSGDEEACNNAGLCLERGSGTEKNIHDAMAMYHLGATRSNPQAMYSLGFLLVRKAITMHDLITASEEGKAILSRPGLGISIEASSYLSQAKEKNHETLLTLIDLGIIPIPVDLNTFKGMTESKPYDEIALVMNQGLYWMKRAVEGDIFEAAFQLGQIYEQGLGGVPIDPQSAYNQYSYAALRSNPPHPKATLCAAHMLYAGYGVKQDYMFAGYLYELAANAGLVDAMNALAILLEEGLYTLNENPNIDAAATWYLEAAKLGSEQAGINLALLLKNHSTTLALVTTRLGATLTSHEVYKYLLKQIPSSKYIFQQQQQEYLELLQDATKNGNKNEISNQDIGKSESKRRTKAYRYAEIEDSLSEQDHNNDNSNNNNNNNNITTTFIPVPSNETSPNATFHSSLASNDTSWSKNSSPPVRIKQSKPSGSLSAPKSLRGELRGSDEMK